MSNPFASLDPNEAWAPYRVSESGWSTAQASHLYRRAGFGASFEQLKLATESSPPEIVDQLLVESSDIISEFEAIKRTVIAGRDPKGLPPYWLYRMMLSPAQLLEKMTLFWHGHFATSAEKVTDVRAMLAQNRLLRQEAVGSFRRLVNKISRDPAMLVYLDSTVNRRTHPNENYARELLELFCLGLGNYTERDIQELARCFTGWEVRRGRFRFNRYQHDQGTKSLFGTQGKLDGAAAINVILDQAACPRFLVNKLVRFFVTDDPRLPDRLLEPLVTHLKDVDFELEPVVKRMLTSRLMFSGLVIGSKVRSPVELAVGFLRAFGATTDLNRLADRLQKLGQLPYFPPNVKGWDGGRKWINTSTVLGRANLIDDIVHGNKTRWRDGDLGEWLARQKVDVADGGAVTQRLVDFMFAVPPSSETIQRIARLADKADLKNHQHVGRIVHTLAVLPEFQLS